MSFPLYTLLILYFIFLCFYFIFALASLYHLAKYGGLTFTGFLMFFLFLAITIIILFISYEHLAIIDWRRKVEFFDFTDKSSKYF